MTPGPFQIALTYDVERNSPPFIRSSGKVYSGLDLMPEVLGIMRSHGAPGTWYIAHDIDEENQIARQFPSLVAEMAGQGEIGSHFHFREFAKVRTDEAFQRQGVGEATRFLRSLGHQVTGFRGGNLFMNPSLFSLLGELGYETDSSVLPGQRVTMHDGLRIDHSGRRSCEPYYPVDGDPWSAGGRGILEIPLTAYPAVSLQTPLLSILINFLLLISNLVLVNPDEALARLQKVRAKWPTGNAVIMLSTHPHDFLGGRLTVETKMRNFDQFLGAVRAIPGMKFATAADIRAGWVSPDQARCEPRDRALLKVTTSDVRRVRQMLRRPSPAPHTDG